MRVERLETLFCDAGWRPWIFLKATADDGSVGWAEFTDSHGSPRGLAGIVEDLGPLVVGQDPRAAERIYWDLYRHTRQSPGSVIAKAIGGIENAHTSWDETTYESDIPPAGIHEVLAMEADRMVNLRLVLVESRFRGSQN